MTTTHNELAVFAWLPDGEAHGGRFLPAGLLNLTETVGANPLNRELASRFAYGLGYLKRPGYRLPPLMFDACITALMQGRLFERDIFMEKFFSAADVQQVRSPLFKKI